MTYKPTEKDKEENRHNSVKEIKSGATAFASSVKRFLDKEVFKISFDKNNNTLQCRVEDKIHVLISGQDHHYAFPIYVRNYSSLLCEMLTEQYFEKVTITRVGDDWRVEW
jgi:hypothetical protein